jgi:hypothetical protein
MALALAGAAAWAQMPPGTVIEGSIETNTDALIFPLDAHGRITVRNCGGCQSPTLQLDAATQFQLAGHSVTLREMADYAHQTSGRLATIHYRLSDKIVSRISINGQ